MRAEDPYADMRPGDIEEYAIPVIVKVYTQVMQTKLMQRNSQMLTVSPPRTCGLIVLYAETAIRQGK